MPACTKVLLPWQKLMNWYELLLHPLYSPDLASSDFHLFPKLKILLGGQRFSTMEELTVVEEGYFAGLEESHF
jgi:hypothetical protein